MRTISEVQNSVNRFRIAIRTCNSACLTIEVPRHDPLAHQLDAPHLGLDQAAPVIAAPALPDIPTESQRSAQDLVVRAGSRAVLLPRFPGILSHRNDGLGLAQHNDRLWCPKPSPVTGSNASLGSICPSGLGSTSVSPNGLGVPGSCRWPEP